MSNTVKNFESAMAELEQILHNMGSNDISIDESVKLYAKAAKLMQVCNQKLEKAKIQISEIDEKMDEMRESDAL